MDIQPTPSFPEPRPAAPLPERFGQVRPEQTPQPGGSEVGPRPGQPPAAAPPPSAQAGLTAADAAAAIAAMPMPPNVTTPMAAGGPLAAADQDLIEPEWVDKVEDVLRRTAGDPHLEEEAVENLQIDYLKKRYGREVKKPDGT